MRYRRTRSQYLLIDKLGNTNAGKALADEFRMEEGELGHCHKKFPVKSRKSFGFFFILCTCANPSVLLFGLMDSGESSRFPYEAIINRWKIPPKVIFYDNGCHFHAYCMARNSVYFMNTLFLIDSLHWANHVAICSCLNRREEYGQIEDIRRCNSQACEQLNSQLRSKCAAQVSKMDPINALVYLAVFVLLYNFYDPAGKPRV